ncbi:MAG: hypothetical protein CSB34_05110 [Desulfobulbus propionicus]|nr:MAG: hypothetical protein CSB34_05110 [Desulfobulbus propionicus]
MENNVFHILITGESGANRSLTIQRNTIRNLAIMCATALFCGCLSGIYNYFSFTSNQSLESRVAELQQELEAEQQRKELTPEVLAEIHDKDALIKQYEKQIIDLQEQQHILLEESVSRLDERAKIIESIMDSIGVELKIEEDSNHSGGPFVAVDNKNYGEKLLSNTDKYLDILAKVPIGKPLPSIITSGYGRRSDPFNHKRAFHEGVDFKGKTGDKIRATAGGTVKKSAYSKSWGNVVVIDHHNGYETLFAHLHKRLVKKGDKIERGKVIGLVGSTGRSTGPHLHFELHYKGRHINPMKYIKVANLSMTVKK